MSAGAGCGHAENRRVKPGSSCDANVPHGLFKAPVLLPAGHQAHILATVPHLPEYREMTYCPDF